MDLAQWDFSPGDSTPEFHDLLDDAIEYDPEFAVAYAAKANAYAFNRHELDLAVQFANAALDIDPDLGSAYSALAVVYSRQMLREQALDASERAYELSPTDIDVLDNFARLLGSLGDLERGIAIAEEILQMDPKRRVLLANIQWNNGKREDALENIRRAALDSPSDESTQSIAAVYELLAGDRELAEQHKRIAVELVQPDDWSLYLLGVSIHRYGRVGAEETANRLYAIFERKMSAVDEDNQDLALWVRACLGIGDIDCVRSYLERCIVQIRNGFRPANLGAVAFNRYDDPQLDEPELVELRRQLGYDVPGI